MRGEVLRRRDQIADLGAIGQRPVRCVHGVFYAHERLKLICSVFAETKAHLFQARRRQEPIGDIYRFLGVHELLAHVRHFVSTVGRDEEVIREYIRHQELEDARLEQLNLWR